MTHQEKKPLSALFPIEQSLLTTLPSGIQWNEQFTVMFQLEGSLKMQLNGETLTLHENDIAFMPAFTTIVFYGEASDFCVLSLQIKNDFMKKCCPDIEEISFRKNYVRHAETEPFYEHLCQILANIIHLTLKKEAGTILKITSNTALLLSSLIEHFGSKKGNVSEEHSGDGSRERMLQIAQYINEHYMEKISLPDIADYVGLHPQYFSKLFKREFGSNFSDYLNDFRVSKSIPDLLHTKKSILDLAMEYGFSSHKTYSAAVKKSLGVLPTDFRRRYQESGKKPYVAGESEVEPEHYFRFFQRYWAQDHQPSSKATTMQNHCSVFCKDSGKRQDYIRNNLFHMVTVGRAFSCLRSDMQEQIRASVKYLHLEYIKIRDIFSDDMFVYSEDENKEPFFSWQTLDKVFDFLLSVGVRPFIEIGFMPRALALKKQYSGFQYHPSVSTPKSMTKWRRLISAFFTHLIERYGLSEVRCWYFDFWLTPNLNTLDGWWNESKEDFFRFYLETARAIYGVDEQIRLGTSSFSCPSGYDWYDDFLTFVEENHLHPAFLNAHLYACGDDPSVSNGDERTACLYYIPDNAYESLTFPPPQKDHFLNTLADLQGILDRHHMDLPIICSDSSVSYVPTDLTRDTCFLGPYLLYTQIHSIGKVDSMCVRSISDINDDYFINDQMFHGGPGLINYNGIPKAAYHALHMLNCLSADIIQKGDNYVITRTENGYQILLFNLIFYDELYCFPDTSALSYTQRYNIYENNSDLFFHLYLTLEPGNYNLTKEEVSRDYGSAYDVWLNMGMPDTHAPQIEEFIRKKSVPEMTWRKITASPTALIDEVVHPHGVTLITLERVQKI